MKKSLGLGLTLLLLVGLADFAQGKASKRNGALENAISAGDLKTVKKLVKAGADVNQKFGTTDETALTLAALNGRAQIVEYLIKHNADVNVKTKNGLTALFFASYGSVEGAEKSTYDQPDYTAVIKFLVASGADVTIRDDQGETAMDVAKKNHRSAEILKMLSPP